MVMGRRSAQGRSNAVRVARTTQGLTQAELAAAAGVTRQTVVAVEAGDYAPSVYLALAMAERLGRSVEELFGHGAAAGVDAAGAGHAGGNEGSNR